VWLGVLLEGVLREGMDGAVGGEGERRVECDGEVGLVADDPNIVVVVAEQL